MNYQSKFDSIVSQNFNKYVRTPQIVYGILILLITLYISQATPQLPMEVVPIIDNTFFKLFAFIIILLTAQVSPSLSILIAISFVILINYVNNRKLFEFFDPTTTATITTQAPSVVLTNTPVDAITATNLLTMQALSGSKGDSTSIAAATQAITTAIPAPDQKTVEAVNTLVNNALSPNAGDAMVVGTAMNTVNEAVNKNMTTSTITPTAAVQALQVLSNAASTPGVNNNAVVATAANVIATIAPETTPAISALVSTSQQPVSTPVNVQEINNVVQNIVETITTPAAPTMATTTTTTTTAAPEEVECYPMRHVDMSKVNNLYEGVMVEEYQTFKPSA